MTGNPVAPVGKAGATGLHDERRHTRWAQPGWLSWDRFSPEQDFCRFVGMLQRMLAPAVVLETGVGAGRVTQHLDTGACRYLGFESEQRWRCPPAVMDQQTPTVDQVAAADLVVLDSAPEFRLSEIALWGRAGKPGSLCVVHDCGNGHPPEWTTHHSIWAAVDDLGFPGSVLANPRGGWLGWHRPSSQ